MDHRDLAAHVGTIKEPVLLTEAGDEVALPWRFEACPTCEGRGKYVNPGIDSHGISGEEMAELGPDFQEEYMSGVYDVRCAACGGRRVVPVVEEAGCTPDQLKAFQEQEADLVDMYREMAAERAMGA